MRLQSERAPPRIADGIRALCARLDIEVARLDATGSEPRTVKQQRAAHEAVPWDFVPDAKALLASVRALLDKPRKRKRESPE